MRQTKLVAIDLDGTLLTDDHHISERTKKAIKNIREQGIKVVIATGRGPLSCDPYVQQLELNVPVIAHNGAVIYEPGTQNKTFEIGYPAQELLPIIQYCRREQIHFDLSTAFAMYIEGGNDQSNAIYEQFMVNPSLMKDTSQIKDLVVKVSLFDQKERLDHVLQDIVPRFTHWSVVRSGEVFIDIIHPQATKGNALQKLLNKWYIHPEEVVSFGNFFNDLEMIRLAGLGVAMANSPQEVKDEADFVTSSNNQDGVAKVLEDFYVGYKVK